MAGVVLWGAAVIGAAQYAEDICFDDLDGRAAYGASRTAEDLLAAVARGHAARERRGAGRGAAPRRWARPPRSDRGVPGRLRRRRHNRHRVLAPSPAVFLP